MEVILSSFPDLTDKQKEQFAKLKLLYEDWNSMINVISRQDLDQFYERHVLHSLAIAKVIEFKDGTQILDVGTGGGFPLIPLAIFFPNVEFLGVDSIGKKIKVVQDIVEQLGLENVKAEHKRAEEVQAQFDFIIGRAVTRTKRFLSWVQGKISPKSFNDLKNGYLFLKGGDLEEELTETKRKYIIYKIDSYFKEAFFETKKVVYISN